MASLVVMTEVTARPTRADVEHAVALAVRAPSIHNTQPWRWLFTGQAVELFADRSRQLTAVDPDGRGLLVSCGGALYLAGLGLAARGWRVEVDRLPDPATPDLLARIRVVGRRTPEESTLALAEAARRRQSERRPFRPDPVPAELLEELRLAATEQGISAHLVTRPDERLDLAVAVAWADRLETADESYRAELARWVRSDPAATDGVPSSAVPHVPPGAPRHTEVPVRDFEAGVAGGQPIPAGVDEQPAFVVLFTGADDAGARLRSGEAYVRVSVEAERLGLATSAITQAVDLPAVRSRLRTMMDWPDHPQMIMRVGWPPAGSPRPPTQRRPVYEVLTVAPGT
jgi:nitroreductase